jgi:hypothetical protein
MCFSGKKTHFCEKKILQATKNAIIYPYNQGWLSPSTQPNSSW